jgi:serine/threonine protein kinase
MDALRRGPFRPEAALRIVEQVADALDTAHRRGVVHRDLKPGNVMLDREDNAYLTDFGIAKNLDASQTMTSAVGAPGTPATMAPEQIRG